MRLYRVDPERSTQDRVLLVFVGYIDLRTAANGFYEWQVGVGDFVIMY